MNDKHIHLAKTSKKNAGAYWIIYSSLGLLLLVSFLSWVVPKKSDICPVSSAGLIVPDRVLDGQIFSLSSSIVIQDQQKKSLTQLAYCNKGCTGPIDELRPWIHQIAHVEFCGKTITRIILPEKKLLIVNNRPFNADELVLQNLRARSLFFYMLVFFIAAVVFGKLLSYRRAQIDMG